MDRRPSVPAPKSFGDIVADSWYAYSSGFAVYVGIAAVALVPLALLSGALWAIGEFPKDNETGWVAWDLLFPVGTLVFYILVYPVMQGALIHATAERQVGRPVSVLGAYSAVFSKAGRLIGAWLLVGFLLLLMMVPFVLVFMATFRDTSWAWPGMVLLVAALPLGCYFSIKWLLVLQQVLLEGSGVGESLGRSSTLVAGHWWRSFGIWTVLSLIPSLVLGIPISIILSAFSVEGLSSVVVQGILPEAIIVPLSAASQTLLHFDLRVRKLQSIAQLMPEGAEAPPPPGPEYSPPAPDTQAQPSRRPNLKPALLVTAAAVVLVAAAITSVVLWQRHQAEASDIRVSARSLSTGREVRVSDGDLDSIDFTDFAFEVEFKGFVEAGAQQNTVRIIGSGYPGLDGPARVRVYARNETLAQFNAPVQYGSYLPPEFEPENELSVIVEVLDEHRVTARSATGGFPAASQVVLELDYGNETGYVARFFTQ